MRHVYGASLLLPLLFGFIIAPVHAGSLTSKELIDGANFLDGRRVSYEGEAVTAVMDRGDHSWVNINDGYNAIGIYCKKEFLKSVRFLGDYKNKGDMLEVDGVFHRACPLHNGELDIHADRVNITALGYRVEERLSVKRIRVAAAFFIVTLLSVVLLRKRI